MNASLICDRCGSAARADFIQIGKGTRGVLPLWIVKVACPRCGDYNRVKHHKSASAVVVQATWGGLSPSFANR